MAIHTHKQLLGAFLYVCCISVANVQCIHSYVQVYFLYTCMKSKNSECSNIILDPSHLHERIASAHTYTLTWHYTVHREFKQLDFLKTFS